MTGGLNPYNELGLFNFPEERLIPLGFLALTVLQRGLLKGVWVKLEPDPLVKSATIYIL